MSAVDLNGLLASIMGCDNALQEMRRREVEAIDMRIEAEANLSAAQAAFDAAVLKARGLPVTPPQPAAQDAPPAAVAEKKIPMGGLPSTSPALRYDRLPGAVDDADDAREDNVEAT